MKNMNIKNRNEHYLLQTFNSRQKKQIVMSSRRKSYSPLHFRQTEKGYKTLVDFLYL